MAHLVERIQKHYPEAEGRPFPGTVYRAVWTAPAHSERLSSTQKSLSRRVADAA